MSRPKGSSATPGYCRHKSSNRGYATIDGSVIYFPGNFGTLKPIGIRPAHRRIPG